MRACVCGCACAGRRGQLFWPHLNFSVGAADVEKLSVRAVAERERVVTDADLLAQLRTGKLVKGHSAVEAPHSEHVVGLVTAGVPREAPNLSTLLDQHLLHARLVSDAHVTIVVAQREVPGE